MEENQLISGDSVLVFAPHNDDEILGAGGLMQRYLESDASVKVVVMTNGDGQVRRPNFLPFFRADFIKLGYRRQNETIEAMDYLGLSEDEVSFLGYPDRGLSPMWTKHWKSESPYFSRYTKTDHSPYDNSYTENAPYCGSSVVKDVKQLLLDYEPDVVFLPHPNDSHPDHWATNGFVLYGIEKLKSEGYEQFEDTKMLNYLVHSVGFPWPRGQFLDASLKEPSNLNDLDTRWVKVPLRFRERLHKLRAISKYRTQNQLMRKYLVSFARANELFGIVPGLGLNHSVEYQDTPVPSSDFVLNEEENEPFLSYLDPKRRSRMATIKRYPDLKSVTLVKNTESIKLGIDFFNRYRPGNEIGITLKPLGSSGEGNQPGDSHTFKFHRANLYHNGSKVKTGQDYDFESKKKYYRLSIPLDRINSPAKLILSITLGRKDVTFARSANRLVKLS